MLLLTTWQPLSLSLRFSPSCSLFPYSHPYPAKGVLAIRHTNDCVSNPVISGTLRSVRPGGLYRYLRIVRILEVSVTVQLHRFTHEIINNLSISEQFSALLAIYSIILPRCFLSALIIHYICYHILFS